MSKKASSESFYHWWNIGTFAKAAATHCADVFRYCFAASILHKCYINDRMSGHFVQWGQRLAFVMWAYKATFDSNYLTYLRRNNSLIRLMPLWGTDASLVRLFLDITLAYGNAVLLVPCVCRFQY